MASGVPYDSDEGRALTAAFTAIMTGVAYATSAEMAEELGAFPRHGENADLMLRVIRNHRRAAYGQRASYEELSIAPVPLEARDCPRSEEHTSELQSLMRISYAVSCLKKKNRTST